MKYKWKRYWLWICILGLVILTLTILRSTQSISIEIFLGLSLTCITLFISIINHFQNSDKFFKELFTDFNKRYDGLNNFLNQIKDDQKLTEVEKQRVIDYLNLCAEEYMWVKKGWIPEHIWTSWKNGIKLHQSKSPIKEVFEEERRLWKSSYYGFFDEID